MVLVIIFVFGLLAYVYWKAAIYAAPFFMAFIFGKLAGSMGGSFIMIALAALAGVLLAYFILALLRELGAAWAANAIIFGASFYFAYEVIRQLMIEWGQGSVETVLVAVLAGGICGVTAVTRYQQQILTVEDSA